MGALPVHMPVDHLPALRGPGMDVVSRHVVI